jgi:hypothetical protein
MGTAIITTYSHQTTFFLKKARRKTDTRNGII